MVALRKVMMQHFLSSEFILKELEVLHRRAIRLISTAAPSPTRTPMMTSLRRCMFFYRNKPLAYFEEFMTRDGVMRVYRKNSNGDAASPINNVLPGLFFIVNVDLVTDLPIGRSIFGEQRVKSWSAWMFRCAKLFFTDQYRGNSDTAPIFNDEDRA